MDSLKIWGEYGGLIGLVIGSLFLLVILFINTIKRKDKDHQNFLSKILDDEREERKEHRKEHKHSVDRLSDALTQLSNNLK